MATGEIKTSAYDVVYLSGCAINGLHPDLKRVQNMDFASTLQVAESLSLAAITCIALESAYDGKLPDTPVFKEWMEKKDLAIYKNLKFDIETKEVTDFLNEREIWYLPLKGSVLKAFYPVPEMREMCDVDILFDKRFHKTIHDWFVKRGYDVKSYQFGCNDIYLKESFYKFEMHRDLFLSTVLPKGATYYENIEGKLIHDDNCPRRLHFKDEDFYIYMLLHMCKHIKNGGTGLRSLLDCYAFLTAKGNSLDWKYIHQELSKLEAESFEKEVRNLAEKVFANPESLPIESLLVEEKSLLDSFLSFGTYGTIENRVNIKLSDMRGDNESPSGLLKLRYIRERLFPSPEYIKAYCSFFDRHSWLLPAGYVFRFFRQVITNRKRLSSEWDALRKS